MKEKLKEIIKNNDGCVVKGIKILNDTYDLKPFDDTKESLDAISYLYSDFYINSFMLTPVEMNDIGYKEKLDYILKSNNEDGFTYWNIYNRELDKTVGIYGLKKTNLESKELDITFMSKIGSIMRPISEFMVKFVFENFDIEKLHGNTLSYNQPSQKIARELGMEENGIQLFADDYVRDSYCTKFVLTRSKYCEIKKANNGIYKLCKLPKNPKPNDIHSKSRYLCSAIREAKLHNNVNRLLHLQKLSDYRKQKYPLICKKEKE